MLHDMTFKRTVICFWLLISCLVMPVAYGQQTQVNFVGSDYLQPLVEKWKATVGSAQISLQGSYMARRSLKSGSADAALIIWNTKEEEWPKDEFEVQEWGYLTLQVVVAESNPLPELSVKQLGSIYLSGREDSFSRWGDLGLSGGWGARSIVPFIYQDSWGIFPAVFQSMYREGSKFRAGTRRIPDTNLAVSEASSQNASILLMMYGYPHSGMKLLPIVGDRGQIAYLPTPENIESGRYPLVMPIKLVYRKSSIRQLTPLLFQIYSDDAFEQAKSLGIAAPSEATIARYRLNLEFVH
jgi:phosphate transport system substrate-binding protein